MKIEKTSLSTDLHCEISSVVNNLFFIRMYQTILASSGPIKVPLSLRMFNLHLSLSNAIHISQKHFGCSNVQNDKSSSRMYRFSVKTRPIDLPKTSSSNTRFQNINLVSFLLARMPSVTFLKSKLSSNLTPIKPIESKTCLRFRNY